MPCRVNKCLRGFSFEVNGARFNKSQNSGYPNARFKNF